MLNLLLILFFFVHNEFHFIFNFLIVNSYYYLITVKANLDF